MTALLERAELTEIDPAAEPAELDQDPTPGKRTRRRPKATATKTPAPAARTQSRSGGRLKTRAQVQAAMAEELEMYAKMLALTWSMSDEHCGAALNETSANIARDAAALMARSDWIVDRFEGTTMLADCMKLLHSIMPLLRAVWVHHIAGRDQEQEQEGVERVTAATDYGTAYAPFRPAFAG